MAYALTDYLRARDADCMLWSPGGPLTSLLFRKFVKLPAVLPVMHGHLGGHTLSPRLHAGSQRAPIFWDLYFLQRADGNSPQAPARCKRALFPAPGHHIWQTL